jgi:hypothetical protein
MNKLRLKQQLRSASSSPSWRDSLLVMSFDADGFRREKAVRLLGIIGDPVAIPCLFKRANDWVPEVRTAARKALFLMLRSATAAAFVTTLPALMHLQVCRRDDHGELIQSVQSFLLREENIEHLIAGLQHPDAQVARITTQLLASRRCLSIVQLIKISLSHPDVTVRSSVIDLLKEADSDGFDEVIDTALRDPYMPIRREAFQQLLAKQPSKGLQIARSLLFDASASIRGIAINRLMLAGIYVQPSTRRH